jgi:hypothetical protein
VTPADVRLLPYERFVAGRCFAAAANGRYGAFASNVDSWGIRSMTYSAAAIPGLTIAFLVLVLSSLLLKGTSGTFEAAVAVVVGISGLAFLLGLVRATQALLTGIEYRKAAKRTPPR